MPEKTQFLLFSVGGDRYALEAKRIREVFPAFSVKALPGAPRGVIGLLDYHGSVIPAVDLSLMLIGYEGVRSLSTRFLVVDLYFEGVLRPLALLVEKATETILIADDEFQSSAVEGEDCLSMLYASSKGLIQRVEVERLLSQEVLGALWKRIGDERED